MKYAVISAVVTDEIHFADKTVKIVPGGAGIYALSGIKLWQDDAEIVTGIGKDYLSLHGDWYTANNLSTKGLKVKDEKSPYTVIQYYKDGERDETPRYGAEHFARLETTGEELIPYLETMDGIYIFKNTSEEFWKPVLVSKKHTSCRIMWEIAADAAVNDNLARVREIAKGVDAFSLNMTEAKNLFGTVDKQRIISELQSWGLELVFLRQGAKGAMMITPSHVEEVLSQPDVNAVDSTGGGNSSTGAVLCGLVEGYDARTCGIMGSISAAMCISQYGVPKEITSQMREEALKKLVKKESFSAKMRKKDSILRMHDTYEYYHHVPERGLVINGKPAMTQIDPELVGDFVLITVRDPLCAYDQDPAKVIADKLENAVLIGCSGMFTSYTGTYKGAKITVVSGGSGSPEMELILYDYMEYTDAKTFLRVGGSGGIGDEVRPGDVVIASGVVREEGMTKAYIPAEYPAASHYEVVAAMVKAAELLKAPYHVGVTVSVDSDFIGGGRPGVGGYMQPWNRDFAGIYNRAGVLNGDRESASIVTLSALFGRRGGSICSVADNLCTGEVFGAGKGHNFAIDIALEGCAFLNEMDKQKEEKGRENWYPGIEKE